MSCVDTLRVVRGTSHSYGLSFDDEDGDPKDLTDYVIYFRVKKILGDDTDPVLIAKDSTDDTQIFILPQVDATLGQATLYLMPDDTKDIPVGVYNYEVRSVAPDGFVESVSLSQFIVDGEAV